MGSPASSTSEYYDHYWSPEGFRPTGAAFRQLSDRLEHLAQPETSWIDVGCGDGRTSGLWLRTRECSYVGVDVSTPAVEQARNAGLDARLIEDAGDLPFPDESFDGAICVEVFEHSVLAAARRQRDAARSAAWPVPCFSPFRTSRTGAAGPSSRLDGGTLSATISRWPNRGVTRIFASSPRTHSRECLEMSGFTGVSIRGTGRWCSARSSVDRLEARSRRSVSRLHARPSAVADDPCSAVECARIQAAHQLVTAPRRDVHAASRPERGDFSLARRRRRPRGPCSRGSPSMSVAG